MRKTALTVRMPGIRTNYCYYHSDYRPMPGLDRYEGGNLDDEDYDNMSEGDRRAAEEEMRRRDRELGIVRRDERDLFYDDSDMEIDPKRRRKMAEKSAAGETEDTEMIESIEFLEDTKGHPVKEWVTMLGPRTEIKNRFKSFLRTFTNEKSAYVYKDKIRRMCENNQSSFVIEFPNIAHEANVLAYFLPEAPFQMLEIFNEVAKELVLSIFPSYERVSSEIHVRISELPLIEDLRTFR